MGDQQENATRRERPEPAKRGGAQGSLYRNPMGLPDTSPVPKKDQMGMDYIAVYADEEPASDGSLVKLSVDKVQKLGVRTEAVALRELARTVKAVATVQANERRCTRSRPGSTAGSSGCMSTPPARR